MDIPGGHYTKQNKPERSTAWSHMWNVKKVELMETESRVVVTRCCRDGGNGEMLAQENKLSVTRGVCSGNLMYSMVTIIIMYCILEIC